MNNINNEKLAALLQDKARLDWLAAQPCIAVWSGRWASGVPCVDITRLPDDGDGIRQDHFATGETLRAALDDARSQHLT